MIKKFMTKMFLISFWKRVFYNFIQYYIESF